MYLLLQNSIIILSWNGIIHVFKSKKKNTKCFIKHMPNYIKKYFCSLIANCIITTKMISNKSLKYLKSILLLILMLSVNSIYSQSKITNFTLSSSTAQTCDSIVVTIYGEHFCPNDSIVGISHSVSGSDITITLSIKDRKSVV